jgi:type II secretion system protein N
MAPSINLGRRARLALRIGGFVLLGLVSFVFAMQLTFNYDRVVKKYFVDGLVAAGYDVSHGEIDRGIFPGNFTIKGVRIQARPTKADEVPPVLIIDSLEAKVSVLSLIGGSISVEFDATVGNGTLAGEVSFPFKGGSFTMTASGKGIKGDSIPQLRGAVGGLPLLGKIDLGVSINVGNDWRKATGSFTLACPKGCTLGDDQTKFKPPVKSQRTAAMMGDGIEWKHVDIDRLSAKAEIKGGKLQLTKWELESKDAELHVELDVKLAKKFKDLEFTVGCFRYRALPALQQRDAKTAAAIATVGGILGPDELFHVKLEGTWATVKARPKVCTGSEPVATDDKGRSGEPALSATPPPDPARMPDPTAPQPGADVNVPATPVDAAVPVDAAAAGSGSATNGSAGSAGSAAGTADPQQQPGQGQPGQPAPPHPSDVRGEAPPPAATDQVIEAPPPAVPPKEE